MTTPYYNYPLLLYNHPNKNEPRPYSSRYWPDRVESLPAHKDVRLFRNSQVFFDNHQRASTYYPCSGKHFPCREDLRPLNNRAMLFHTSPELRDNYVYNSSDSLYRNRHHLGQSDH